MHSSASGDGRVKVKQVPGYMLVVKNVMHVSYEVIWGNHVPTQLSDPFQNGFAVWPSLNSRIQI